ncbi:hypothetical protein GCM10009764_75750 [Nocardia ninae]
MLVTMDVVQSDLNQTRLRLVVNPAQRLAPYVSHRTSMALVRPTLRPQAICHVAEFKRTVSAMPELLSHNTFRSEIERYAAISDVRETSADQRRPSVSDVRTE